MLNELAKQIFDNAKSKGFHEKEHNIGQMLCLIHSEVSEALEAHRIDKYAVDSFNMRHNVDINSKDPNEKRYFIQEFEVSVKNTFEDELADVIIRVLDLCAYKNIDIDKHVKLKMAYNATRPIKHGKNY